jgi:drug/metabolite transporter (DMT)-like permease
MKKAYLYIMLSTILFSSMEISLKIVANQFNPIQLSLLRFLIGSLILAPFAIRKLKTNKIFLSKEDFNFFMLIGLVCVVISMTFYSISILYCKASTVAIILSCNPVFVVPFAYYMLKEKIYKHTIISMLISIAGIIFILNPFNVTGSITGLVFALLASITFALYGVMGKSKSQQFGAIVVTCFSFIFGSIELLILVLLTKISFISGWLNNHGLSIYANIPIMHGITMQNIPNLIYIGVFVTGLGYLFYFLAMEVTSATTASIVFFIKPALSPVLALIILNEAIALNTVIGILLIILGSGITFIANSKRSKSGISQIAGNQLQTKME